ncbi:hypothetical protein J6590_035235 [Homalodisca vitripennis]|nr:hypothetical protein J6590_035235 [Homalodisca vitripennis]
MGSFGVEATETFQLMHDDCQGDYSDGSLTAACTYCGVCTKKWFPKKKEMRNICVENKSSGKPFGNLFDSNKKVCYLRSNCNKKSCSTTLKKCIPIPNAVKCRCTDEEFGQLCNHSVSEGKAIHRYADLKTVVITPLVYANDFATFLIYFCDPGESLNVVVKTDREIMRYDRSRCLKDAVTPHEMCKSLYYGIIRGYDTVCPGACSYEHEGSEENCGIIVRQLFARHVPDKIDKKLFYVDETGGEPTQQDIVGRIESISIEVSSGISVNHQHYTVFNMDYKIINIYRSKIHCVGCHPHIQIHRHSGTMKSIPRLSRNKGISIPLSVTQSTDQRCRSEGKLMIKWYVWRITVNHDEETDPEIDYREGELGFEEYSLGYGTYKMKAVASVLADECFTAISYCYFEVVPLNFQPIILGGNTRNVYYEDDLILITVNSIDPNYSLRNQPDITYRWSCEHYIMICAPRTTKNTSVTIPGPFSPGDSYKFIVELISSKYLEDNIILKSNIQTIHVLKERIPSLIIECLRNCGENNYKSDVRAIFYFRVRQLSLHKLQSRYTWFYYEVPYTQQQFDISEISQDSTPSSILIVNANSLKEKTKYIVGVRSKDNSLGTAEIVIETFGFNENLTCEVDPKSGIAGETRFSISCSEISFIPASVTFTFYDLYKGDEFGRHLGTSFTGSLIDVFLSRGDIDIYASTINGNYMKTSLHVVLTPPPLDSTFLENCLERLKNSNNIVSYEQQISFITSTSDILNSNLSLKSQLQDLYLKYVSDIRVHSLQDVDLLLLATQTIVCEGSVCKQQNLTSNSVGYLSDIISEVSKKLSYKMLKSSTFNSELTDETLARIWKAMLKIVGVLLNVRDESILNKSVPDFNVSFYHDLKKSTDNVLNSLDAVREAFAVRSLPYIKDSLIKTEFVKSWMKKDAPSYFIDEPNEGYNISYIRMSEELAASLAETADSTVVVQTLGFKNDPFWWSQSQEKVSTEVLSVHIGYKSPNRSLHYISSFDHPLDFFLKLKSGVEEGVAITGSVSQPDPDARIDIKDMAIIVYKVFPHSSSEVHVTFSNLTEDDVFKVLLVENIRPDYDYMLDHAFSITKSTPSCKISTSDDESVNTIVYLGILPGENIPIGNTVSYSFNLLSSRCQTRYGVLWTASGCKLGVRTSEDVMHCQCDHLSSVSGFLGVPVNSFDPFSEYMLFLTVVDNPFVLLFVCILLLLYLVLLIWAAVRDRRDHRRVAMEPLEDNIFTDGFCYLITVLTGSRPFAGTTANIGFVVLGEKSSSRAHILRVSRRTLKRGSDDWFVMFTRQHLGEIKYLHLWSDHSGPHPNWYCDKITILDINENTDYAFIIKKWFGVTFEGFCVEHISIPTSLREREGVSEFFFMNTILGLREKHPLMSILSRHPRSPGPRTHRLSIAICGLMITFFTSILFFMVDSPGYEDEAEFIIQYKHVLISIYSLFISLILITAVSSAFNRSYVFHKQEMASSEPSLQRRRETIHLQDINLKLKTLLRKIIRMMQKNYFIPVLPTADPTNLERFIGVNRQRLAFACFLCQTVILVCAFFIVGIGLKMGKVKSRLWLSTLGMSFCEDVFIVSPGKIIAFALILGIFRRPICNISLYDPNLSQISTMKKTRNRKAHRRYLRKIRLEPEYRPLTKYMVRLVYLQYKKIRNWWKFIEIQDVCFSFITTFMIIYELLPKELFDTTYHFEKMFVPRLFDNPTDVLKHVTEYKTFYIQISSCMYTTEWYNGCPMTLSNELLETGWLCDVTHRMIGVPRLRQIRVSPIKCERPSFLDHLQNCCFAPFSAATEDKGEYGFQWMAMKWRDLAFADSPWKYVEPENTSAVRVEGESGWIYSGGGYVATFSRSRRSSVEKWVTLSDANWLDCRSRAVMWETTFYNVNSDSFVSVILVTEFLDSTVSLMRLSVSTLSVMEFYEIVWIIYTVYAILTFIRLIMLVNNMGMRKLIWNFWYANDILFVVVLTFCVLSYAFYVHKAVSYYTYSHKMGNDVFFSFESVIFNNRAIRNILAVLLVLRTIRALKLIKYLSSMIAGKLEHMFWLTWSTVFWISLISSILTLSLQRLLLYSTPGTAQYEVTMSHSLPYKVESMSLTKSEKHNESDVLVQNW